MVARCRYETSTAVSEYLLFHYGAASDMLPYPVGPHEALGLVSFGLDVNAAAPPPHSFVPTF